MGFVDFHAKRNLTVWAGLFLLIGILLRFIWLQDMEWKADEKLMHALAKSAYEKGAIPDLGMPSGVGLPNAGFSIVPFAILYAFSTDPVLMTLGVALVNCIALLLFLVIALRLPQRKEEFACGIGLLSVNLLMVLYSRKLWAQDLLPIFMAGIWYLHTQRRFLLSLVGIGFLGVLAGQLHISGFFYLAGLFFTMWAAKQLNVRSVLAIGLGVLIGMLPAIPWMREVLSGAHTSNTGLHNIVKFEYFLHLLTDPSGINVQYSLGKHVMEFVQYCVYVPALLVMGIAASTVLGLIQLFKRGISKLRLDLGDPLHFYVMAFVAVPGVLLTLSGSPVRSHYLIAAAPFAHAALAALWLKAGAKWYVIGLVCQLLMTIAFLYYVHQFGAPEGDYGIPYRLQ